MISFSSKSAGVKDPNIGGVMAGAVPEFWDVGMADVMKAVTGGVGSPV